MNILVDSKSTYVLHTFAISKIIIEIHKIRAILVKSHSVLTGVAIRRGLGVAIGFLGIGDNPQAISYRFMGVLFIPSYLKTPRCV